MNLLSKVAGLFSSKNKVEPAAKVAAKPRKSAKQVYAGAEIDERPEFAKEVETSFLIKACEQNIACIFTPKFEQHRLYRPTRDASGNLLIEFEGIAVTCPALVQFGSVVAREDGQHRAYRYADLNHILNCCCGKPQRCRFFHKIMAERKKLEDFQT